MAESYDVEMIEGAMLTERDNEKHEDRPIMLLFKQLISNDDKETTVLTNVQIFDILNKEFDMNISAMHKLEVDIYLNVMKKFLKEWPQWRQFDRLVHKLKTPESMELIKSKLEEKYKQLKDYLRDILMNTKPLAEEAVSEVSQATSTNVKQNQHDDVIMEIFCSREELNQLIHRHPKGDLSIDIFNVTNTFQNKIILNTWDIKSILNMWNVKVNITWNSLIYKRQITHKLSHILVNRKHGTNQQITRLDTRLQEKPNKGKHFDKETIFITLQEILKSYMNNVKIYKMLHLVFSLIEKDLNNAPETLKMPARYRQYMNKYPYVRYLYTNDNEIPASSDVVEKYDLQVQETVCPMVEYSIVKVDKRESKVPPFHEWFSIECGECKQKFTGNNLLIGLKGHFNDHHRSEPDWECMNCKLKFDIKQITEAMWRHNCPQNDIREGETIEATNK